MSAWHPDALLVGFEAKEFAFAADYDGPAVATLVRLPAPQAARGAVLAVLGFIAYFFQRHLAERVAAEGYAFHALDLRKHGRSLRPRQHPCFCKDVAEYFDDISRALDEIGEPVLLAGHSTGGLICALYAREGARREQVRALWLNSPFFDWRGPPRCAAVAHRGRDRPVRAVPQRAKRCCLRVSLHRDWVGEWEFDLRLSRTCVHTHACTRALRSHSGALDAFRRGGHRARVARHRALVAHARPGGHGAAVSWRAARSRAVAPRDPRGSLQAAFRLGGTSRSVTSVASAHSA
jgi:pimeloyl-ACP methyl ester carboxylesterase